MKKTLLLAGVAGTLFALNANAMDIRPYVGAKLLYTDVDANMKWSDAGDTEQHEISDKGFGGALSVGAATKLQYGTLRAELEYSKKADLDNSYTSMGESFDTKLKTQSLMLNAYYDIDTGSKITPYVGGGIGLARVELNDQYWKDLYDKKIDDTNFTWQIGAGIAYAVTDNFSVDAGYRYIDYGNMSETADDGYDGEKESVDMTANEIYLGMRYNF